MTAQKTAPTTARSTNSNTADVLLDEVSAVISSEVSSGTLEKDETAKNAKKAKKTVKKSMAKKTVSANASTMPSEQACSKVAGQANSTNDEPVAEPKPDSSTKASPKAKAKTPVTTTSVKIAQDELKRDTKRQTQSKAQDQASSKASNAERLADADKQVEKEEKKEKTLEKGENPKKADTERTPATSSASTDATVKTKANAKPKTKASTASKAKESANSSKNASTKPASVASNARHVTAESTPSDVAPASKTHTSAETSNASSDSAKTATTSKVDDERLVMTAEVPEASDGSAQVFGDTPIVPVRPAPRVKVKKTTRSTSKKTADSQAKSDDNKAVIETSPTTSDTDAKSASSDKASSKPLAKPTSKPSAKASAETTSTASIETAKDEKETKEEEPTTNGLEQLLRPATSKEACKKPSSTKPVDGNVKAPTDKARKKSASGRRSRAKATTKAPCPSREKLVARLKPLEDSPIERVGARSGLSLEGIVHQHSNPDGVPVNCVVHLHARNQTGRPRIAAPLVEKTKVAQRQGHGLAYGSSVDVNHDQVLGETLAVVKAYEASLQDAAPALAAFIDKTLDPNHPAHRAIDALTENDKDDATNDGVTSDNETSTASQSIADGTNPLGAEPNPPQLVLGDLYATPSPETYRYYVENMRYWEEQAAVGAPLLGLPDGDRTQIDAPASVGEHAYCSTTYADVKAQHQQGTTLGGLPIPRAPLIAPVSVRPSLGQSAGHICTVLARKTPAWIGAHTQTFPQSVMTFSIVGGVLVSIVLVIAGFISGVTTLYEKLFVPPVPTFYVVNERRVHDIATLTALAEKAKIPTGRHALRLSPNANDATALSLAPFSTQFDAALRKVSASIGHPLVAMTALVPTHDTVVRDMTPDVLWTLGLEAVNPEHLTSLLQAKATLGAVEKAQPFFDFSLLPFGSDRESNEKTLNAEPSREDIAKTAPLKLDTAALPPDYTPPAEDSVWDTLRDYFPTPTESVEKLETALPQPSHSSMATPRVKRLSAPPSETELPTATRDKPGG